MEKITIVCTTLNKNPELLIKMLDSANGFDEAVLHINQDEIVVTKSSGRRYHVPCKENLSIPDAYNTAICFVDTEWVCAFPDDDYFYPEGLKKMIAEVHKGIDADVAHFKFRVSGYLPPQDTRGKVIKMFTGKSDYILCEKQPITASLLEKHGRMPAGTFFRKSAWEKVGGFQGDFEHDRNLWLRMAKANLRFKVFDILVYEFCRRDNSAWVRQNRK